MFTNRENVTRKLVLALVGLSPPSLSIFFYYNNVEKRKCDVCVAAVFRQATKGQRQRSAPDTTHDQSARGVTRGAHTLRLATTDFSLRRHLWVGFLAVAFCSPSADYVSQLINEPQIPPGSAVLCLLCRDSRYLVRDEKSRALTSGACVHAGARGSATRSSGAAIA